MDLIVGAVLFILGIWMMSFATLLFVVSRGRQNDNLQEHRREMDRISIDMENILLDIEDEIRNFHYLMEDIRRDRS